MRNDLFGLWHEFGMPARRDQIIEEITADVQSGELHSWSQYAQILEPYDDHPGETDGWHDAWRELVDDDLSLIHI